MIETMTKPRRAKVISKPKRSILPPQQSPTQSIQVQKQVRRRRVSRQRQPTSSPELGTHTRAPPSSASTELLERSGIKAFEDENIISESVAVAECSYTLSSESLKRSIDRGDRAEQKTRERRKILEEVKDGVEALLVSGLQERKVNRALTEQILD
jgi:hypothetical protein